MFALHIDMNFAAFKKEALKRLLKIAASVGYDTIVWEIENKVQLETLGSAVHPDALSKADFRVISGRNIPNVERNPQAPYGRIYISEL